MEIRKSHRDSLRKIIPQFKLTNLSVFAKHPRFAKGAELVDLSTDGMLIHVHRSDLNKSLKHSFELKDLEGRYMSLVIESMDLELDALIVRTKKVSKDVFEIALDYSESAPEYWRECLFDMIPVADDEEEE